MNARFEVFFEFGYFDVGEQQCRQTAQGEGFVTVGDNGGNTIYKR